ncbi:alcohol dehydrogenase 1-like isoform X2 [Mastomys coucha]|uniref:alcohol dehydrogenase 1-like isoform X2 n=1 Tax=Mastomys coucha TaxID=35658 RepID=UPI001261D55D|nr:alcohol dehydrogenase 1-like isoform X2 [Mastomys coucha]
MGTMGKTITCRAAIAWAENSPLSIEEVQVEPPKSGEVRVKMISSGICGSDDHVLKGELVVNFPLIPGHEGAGIVESVGDGVCSVKPGDKALILIIPQCRECDACLHPKGNFCDKQDVLPCSGVMMDGTCRFSCRGQKIYHSFRTSSFTEYTVVPEFAVVKIDDAAPMDKVCLISCGFPTGYGAAVNSAKVTPGSTCVVFGLGGVGSAIVMGCKASGASRIIGVDINEQKFPRARALGVTDCLNPDKLEKPVQEVVKEMTGVGVDFAFEAIGQVDTMVAAWNSCKNSYGVCLIIGLAPSDAQLCLEASKILSGKTLRGVCLGESLTMSGVHQLNKTNWPVSSRDPQVSTFPMLRLHVHTMPDCLLWVLWT